MASSRLLNQLLGGKLKTNIRISGLVKAMTIAREQLTSGIPEDGVEEFRTFISQAIANTDQICRSHRIRPQDLPAPSFRAYQYLNQIDMKNLPIVDEPVEVVPRIRVNNLNAAIRHIQERMMSVAREIYAGTPGARKQMREVQNLVAQHNNYLQLMLKKKKAGIEHLPLRSGNAAMWLKYLNEDEHFQKTMAHLVMCCESYEALRKKSRTGQRMPSLKQMYFEFTPMAALYRWRVKNGLGQMSIHPGFLSADDETIDILLSSAILRRSSKRSLLIRKTASSAAFMAISRALEVDNRPDDGVGQYFDLNELYEDVNRQYFQGKCEKPIIKWGTRITRRKFGVYLPSSDTIMVSPTLDQQFVPRYVVAFIVYHELLHKRLGMKETAKRQIAHTTQFRKMEKQFVKYDEAQRFLEKMARTQ